MHGAESRCFEEKTWKWKNVNSTVWTFQLNDVFTFLSLCILTWLQNSSSPYPAVHFSPTPSFFHSLFFNLSFPLLHSCNCPFTDSKSCHIHCFSLSIPYLFTLYISSLILSLNLRTLSLYENVSFVCELFF